MSKRAAKPAPKAADTTPEQRKEGGITGKGFVKGDRRINRKGRPKNFDQLRELVRETAGEQLAETGLTRVQAMIIAMSTSRNPRDRELFLQYGFGKVKDELEIIARMTDDELRKFIASATGTNLSGDSGISEARPDADTESTAPEVPAADVAG